MPSSPLPFRGGIACPGRGGFDPGGRPDVTQRHFPPGQIWGAYNTGSGDGKCFPTPLRSKATTRIYNMAMPPLTCKVVPVR